jgi:peptidyl-prolyl cis-trans isomerase B (cyclophilin B)
VAIGAAVVIIALAAVTQVVYLTTGPGSPKPEPTATALPPVDPAPGENVGDIPDPSLAEGRSWTGTLTLNDTALGIELDGAKAPQTVAVFVQEVNEGYFTGKTCHRLTAAPTRLIQCGSLDGTGSGDPAFMFGPIENAPADGTYPAGTIAMARAGGAAYSHGHQFFIMLEAGSIPNDVAGGYTIFGMVTSGLDGLITSIADAGTVDGSADGPPAVPTIITGVTIQ